MTSLSLLVSILIEHLLPNWVTLSGESGDAGWIGFSSRALRQLWAPSYNAATNLFPKFKESVRLRTQLSFRPPHWAAYPDKTKGGKTFHAVCYWLFCEVRKRSRFYKELEKL